HIYYGVDLTWYAGATFSRPILNGDRALIGSGDSCTAGNRGVMFDVTGTYIDIDNLEMSGLLIGKNDPQHGCETYIAVSVTTGLHLHITNNYIHGWALQAGGSPTSFPSAVGVIEVAVAAPTDSSGAEVDHNVIDGSDSPLVIADPNCTGPCTQDGEGL